ncbi:hypothetical protein Cyast_0416 [Cyanobacterium stanieri PCC 7202]|uniref:Uncharacterized protein n=1 Tax=Cyanobacterium stanieri (strain ATCC 29140 / PCC 7202) TaxID=292563 RepID=K9YHF4_CYASC|nr:hypothetical protein Cyast_0416 [Cyanobacterium stanieri PCC 7202]
MKTKTNTEKKSTWWNKPLIGNQSLVSHIKNIIGNLFSSKEEIPSETIALYQHSLEQTKNIGRFIERIDKDKFTSAEFLKFYRMNIQVKNNSGDFEGLKNSLELLQVALDTKDCFLKIEQTESRYFGYAQQDFYQYVYDLLSKQLEPDIFKEKVLEEMEEVIKKVKTEEGKLSLQSYYEQLDILSKNKLGLTLLMLFKAYDLSDFSLLRNVAEIADNFYNKDLDSLKEFNIVVQVNVDKFLRLGKIIKVPRDKNNPQTYALFLQYIALRHRYSKTFFEFQQLLKLLKDWEVFYDNMMTIKKEYPSSTYKQPKTFSSEIVALDVYKKYQKYVEKFEP